MASKRVIQNFEEYFSNLSSQEILISKQRSQISDFKFKSYEKYSQKELYTTIKITDNINSFLEFEENSVMISTIEIEEGVEFNLDFYAHSNTTVLLKCVIKKGATCNISGYYSSKKDKNWIFIELLHEGEDSSSDLKVFGYTSNESQSINDGLVQIGRNAQNSSGYQTMTNYVLSQKAKVFSEPQLEIFNPNVTCSHGSTISPIEESNIYYLKSRGLSHDESIYLLENSMYESFLQRAEDNK